MSWRLKIGRKKTPEGFEDIEEALDQFEEQMKEAVNEDHNGKRKNELNWRVHRIHWEKNRFVFKMMYEEKTMSKKLFDFLIQNKIADGPLISKWRKPGYERLCSLAAIQTRDTSHGTTSVCRVPLKKRGSAQISPSVVTGCVSCCSSDPGVPIWWNSPLPDLSQKSKKNKAGGENVSGDKRPRDDDPPKERPVHTIGEDVDSEDDEEFQKRLKVLRGESTN